MVEHVEKLRKVRDELRKAEKAADRLRDRRDVAILAAVLDGVKPAEVARASGVTPARVSQLAPVKNVSDTVIHAQEEARSASGVKGEDTVPRLPDTFTGSGIVTQRRRMPYGKRTIFRDTRAGFDSIPAILADAEATGATRVLLSGPAPVDYSTGATKAEATRAWAYSWPGEGWAENGHFLGDIDLPLLRYKHDTTGQRVTILRTAAWWGESDADAAMSALAWDGLEKALDAVPAFRGAGLADTPATTGRALWLRTIPEGGGFEVQSAEVRELLHATSGQGRVEVLPRGGASAVDFTVLDGRLMYAALTWGMPVGAPTFVTGKQLGTLDERGREKAMRGRSRWRVTATVPAGWEHVGLLPAASEAGTWVYPRKPGERFTSWVDGSEAWLAHTQGWHLTVHEGITWAEGKPLERWRDALVSVWKQANASPRPEARLAAKAVRSLILFSIGGFATRAHPETHSVPDDRPQDVPAGAEVRHVGDRLLWETPGKLSAWSQELQHPEWAATVWARARVRLLSARGVNGQDVGALALDPARIVGFATDAIYLAGGAPAWADDGEPGRFRVKGTIPGAFTWPRSLDGAGGLWALSGKAEA